MDGTVNSVMLVLGRRSALVHFLTWIFYMQQVNINSRAVVSGTVERIIAGCCFILVNAAVQVCDDVVQDSVLL